MQCFPPFSLVIGGTISYPYNSIANPHRKGGGAGLHPFVHARQGWLWWWCDEGDETCGFDVTALVGAETATNEAPAGSPDEGEGELCPLGRKIA